MYTDFGSENMRLFFYVRGKMEEGLWQKIKKLKMQLLRLTKNL